MKQRLSILGVLLACLSTASHGIVIPETVDAVVSKTPVNTDLPLFETVTQALANSPKNRRDIHQWTILIAEGTYPERVVIKESNIRLIGENRDNTVVVFSRYAGQRVPETQDETWGTRRTATMEVLGKNITIENLTVKNGFDYPANEIKAKDDPTRVSGTQAVALKTDRKSDRVYLKNLALWGYQDTLYLKGDRAFIQGGVIAGHIDFIFGEGTALFEQVTLLSRARSQAMDGFVGYITAPSTNIHRPFGLTFIDCLLERESNVPDNSVALGRPWHPTTTFSDGRYADPFAVGKATFINTYMDSHIADTRWTSMGGKLPSGEKKYFSPHTEARFAEFGSYGKGGKISPSAPMAQHHQLSSQNASFYSPSAVLRGWYPTSQ